MCHLDIILDMIVRKWRRKCLIYSKLTMNISFFLFQVIGDYVCFWVFYHIMSTWMHLFSLPFRTICVSLYRKIRFFVVVALGTSGENMKLFTPFGRDGMEELWGIKSASKIMVWKVQYMTCFWDDLILFLNVFSV